jgi:predicted PurR-regulated permease PerM
MERQGRSRLYGVLLLYILTTALIVLVFLLVVPRAVLQVNDLSKNFSSYYSNIQRNADLFIKQNASTLKRLNIKQESVSEFVNDRSSPVRESVTKFLGGLGGLAQGLFAKAFWLIIIPVATFFLMLDYPNIRAKVIATFPGEFRSHADSISETVLDVFSDYIRGLVKICSLFGFVAFLLYSGLGLDYAVFLGLLAGMFYAIPMVGQLGTSLIVATVAYSMDAHTALLFWKVPPHSVGFALVCVAGTILLGNVFFDQMVYPRVVGGSVGLHPVVSMFALTVGATLYGMPGMLLAVPVAASIQIILKTAFPRLNEASKIQSENDLPPELRASP